MMESSEYTLWYDDGSGLVQNGTNGVKVEFNENITSGSNLSIVCYGGADVYTKAEVDNLISNSGGGSGSSTEITKLFRYTGNGSTSEYNADFISNSIAIFVNGVMKEPSDYTLWYDDGSGLVQNGTNGVKVEFDEDIVIDSTISIVCYGGANVYTKNEVDSAIAAGDILRVDKIIELENISSIRYTGGQNTDLVDLITYSNNYTEIYTYDASDRIIYIDYALSGTVQGSSEKTYDAQGRLSTVTFVDGDTTGSR